MYYNILKSIEHRKKYILVYRKSWFYKLILKNHFLSYSIYRYNMVKNNSILCKIRLRCIINGRSRSVNSKYRLSRFFFKEYSRKGLLNGITKH